MDKNKLKTLLDAVSMNIMDFKDGDLILLSDLIDQFDELTEELKENSFALNIINSSRALLELLMQGEKIENITEILSKAVDLINKIIVKSSKSGLSVDKLLIDDISSFIDSINSEKLKQAKIELKKGKKKKDKKQSLPKKKKTAKKEIPQINIKNDTFKIFVAEADERINNSQDIILKLENDLYNKSYINELFRIFHTIKGECGFLKLPHMGEFTHGLENLLDIIRNNEIENNSSIIDILLNGIDFLSDMINALKNEDLETFISIDTDKFMSDLNEILSGTHKPIGEILKDKGHITNSDINQIIDKQKENGYCKKFGEIAVNEKIVSEKEIKESLESQKEKQQAEKTAADPFIKVKASQINYLVDMIGELIIAENQLADENITRLKKITKSIQNAAMQLRTIKIKGLFINMKRVVRDLCKKLDKKITVKIIGEDLEIDRNLVESLEEPLIHLLRNSIGHGIEDEKDRKNKKKDITGEIIIKAERRGNNIYISVKDDGRGLDKEKILEKAIFKSLVTKEEAKGLTENQIYNFIFQAGFSTAKQVDNVSGRGVGMDIVKNTVSTLRGKVYIDSEKDEYTEVNLIFPLSTAIIDGMIVRSEDNYFIIPVNNIIESLKLEDDLLYKVKNKESVINLRKEIIPVIKLNKFFQTMLPSLEKKREEPYQLAVIVENIDRKYALQVDEILSKKEVVIKPLGEKFKNLRGISSGTVLSGGKVGLVLNIDEIVNTANI